MNMNQLACVSTSPPQLVCVVCNKKTTSFNYGKSICNACKLFFRRSVSTTREMKCTNQKQCFQDFKLLLRCRKCRYEKCIQCGLTPSAVIRNLETPEDELSKFLRHLTALYSIREDKFRNCHVSETLPLATFVTGNITFMPRPEGLVFQLSQWAAMEQITAIYYLKQFKFYKDMNPVDQAKFLWASYIKLTVFLNSARSYKQRCAVMRFPGKLDILPLGAEQFGLPLVNKIRSEIIGRLAGLKATKEELLLVMVVLFCDPSLPGLSKHAQYVLTTHQKIYSSFLLNHCLIKNQKTGPSRFTDLLMLSTVLNNTVKNVNQFYILYQIWKQQNETKPALYNDLLNKIAQ